MTNRLEEPAAGVPLDGLNLGLGQTQQPPLPVQLLGILICKSSTHSSMLETPSLLHTTLALIKLSA